MLRIGIHLLVVLGTAACVTVTPSQVPSSQAPWPWSIHNDPACKLFVWPLPADTAVEILKRTNLFTNTAVYYAGLPTPQIAAFNIVMDQPNAAALFDDIRHTGGPVGCLYALSAFQLLDGDLFQELAAELRASDEQVFTQIGCMGSRELVKDEADAIEKYTTGKQYREARDWTYAHFSGPANICMQATAGGARTVE